MELSKRSNAKLEEANEEELRQNKAIGELIYCPIPYKISSSILITQLSANFLNLDISIINGMTLEELIAKVEHEKLYDETDMAQIEGTIRSGVLNYDS